MRHFRFSQRTLAVALGILAVAYTVQAYRIPEFTAVETPVQPGTLPRGLGLVLIVLSVALFFQKSKQVEVQEEVQADVRKQGQGQGQEQEASLAKAGAGETAAEPAAVKATGTAGAAGAAAKDQPAFGRLADTRLEVAALVGAICVYVAVFIPLGFVLSTALFVTGTAWYLGYRRHWANVLVGVGIALGLYLAMSEGLDVALPTGPLPF
jgi:putative tricarboxylic transport membrane protein